MFIIGKQIDLINTFKSFLNSRFKMKDLSAATFLLGMEIRRLPGGDIQLLQEKYLGEVLQRFPVENPRSTSTPLPPGCKLSSLDSLSLRLQQTRKKWMSYPTEVRLGP